MNNGQHSLETFFKHNLFIIITKHLTLINCPFPSNDNIKLFELQKHILCLLL